MILKSLFTKSLIMTLIFVSVFTMSVPAQAASTIDLNAQLQQLINSLQALKDSLTGQVKAAVTVVVTNDAELAAAIKNSTGGETIQLAPGTYSPIFINGTQYNQVIVGATKIPNGVPTLPSRVTITSQSLTNRAVVKGIEVRWSNNWYFDNLDIRPGTSNNNRMAVLMNGNNLGIENSTITYGDYNAWRANSDWTTVGAGISLSGNNGSVRNNFLSGVYFGIGIGSGSDGTVVMNNTVDGVGADASRLISNNVRAENNLFKNFRLNDGNHDDCLQTWATNSAGNPDSNSIQRGVIIRNNICLDTEGSRTDTMFSEPQGFVGFDGIMTDFIIENNVYISTAYHGLTFTGATNLQIRNNTIIDSDPVRAQADAVWIAVNGNKTGTTPASGNTLTGNITNKFIGSNPPQTTTFTNNQLIKMAEYDTYFRDWTKGDVRLKSTAPVQNVGANVNPASIGSTRTLTGGTGTVTPTPTPTPTPAPTVTLSVANTNVANGSSTTLTWSSTNATSCTGSGAWSGTQTTSGNQTTGALTTAGTQTYTLTCTGAGGNTSRNVAVTVAAPIVVTPTPTPAPTLTLTASPSSIQSGASTNLTWNAQNATSCTASGGWTGTKSVSGSQATGALTSTQTYTLTCTGLGGSVTQSTSVGVTSVPLPPAPTPITTTYKIGDRIEVTKNVNVRTSGLVDTTTLIGVNPVGSIGTITAGPTQSVDRFGTIVWFTVNFDSGFDGWVGADNYKLLPPVVVVPPTPAPTVTLSTGNTNAVYGSSATLTWSSTNATSCTASGAWSGTKTISGTQTTGALTTAGTQTFTLSCTGAGGTTNRNVTVTVADPVVINPTPTDDDGDTIPDTTDNCSTVANTNQLNFDGDSRGDACDTDDDNDGIRDTAEAAGCILNASSTCGQVVTPTPTTTVSNRVTTTDILRVRATANGTILGAQVRGAVGTIDTTKRVTLNGTTWVYVDFVNGPDGYVSQAYLQGESIANTTQTLINSLLAQLAILQAALAALLAQ